MKIIASGLITLCQIDGGKVETVSDFISSGSKINVDYSCSHEIKTFAPWKKAMTNLDSVLKSRAMTLPTKVHIVKAMVFPVVTYRRELDLKKAEQ